MLRRLYRLESGYAIEANGVLRGLVGDPFGVWTAGDEIPGGLAGQRLLAPVAPSKIVAVALNYKAHAAEQGPKPQHCYSVRFTTRELWGPAAGARDQIYIDLFDDYLERA